MFFLSLTLHQVMKVDTPSPRPQAVTIRVMEFAFIKLQLLCDSCFTLMMNGIEVYINSCHLKGFIEQISECRDQMGKIT